MTWSRGHCRVCDRPDDTLGESLGVPPGVWLESDGRCPECGSAWPEVGRCHVCGGSASRGNRWKSLRIRIDDGPVLLSHLDGSPALTLPSLVGLAIGIGEIEASESGRPKRPGINRLLRALDQRTPYYRQAWRLLVGDWLYASELGARVATDEEREKASKAAKG